MRENFEQKEQKYLMRHSTRSIWQRIVSGLSCFVVFCVVYALIIPAITLSKPAYCGLDEHEHLDECYTLEYICEAHEHLEECYESKTVLTLVCEEEHEHLDECYVSETVDTLVCEENEEHVHSNECLEQVLTCSLVEHVHEDQCYANPEAEKDDEQWLSKVPALTGDWSKDVLAVAKSQLGYSESVEDYRVGDDGVRAGYSLFGNLSGNDYAKWDGVFAIWSLKTAGVNEPGFVDCEGVHSVADWMDYLDGQGNLVSGGG